MHDPGRPIKRKQNETIYFPLWSAIGALDGSEFYSRRSFGGLVSRVSCRTRQKRSKINPQDPPDGEKRGLAHRLRDFDCYPLLTAVRSRRLYAQSLWRQESKSPNLCEH